MNQRRTAWAWPSAVAGGTAFARLLLCVGALILAIGLTGAPGLKPLEDRFHDTVIAHAPQRPAPVRAVVGDLSEPTLSAFGPVLWSLTTPVHISPTLAPTAARRAAHH